MTQFARGVLLVVLLLVAPLCAADAGSWVVVHPDAYVGPPGFWALWHAIWHRNTWVVVAAFDSAQPCAERATRDFREGGLPLPELKAKRLPGMEWTDAELNTMKLTLMQACCMPTELAEKIGTLRVSDMVR